MRNPATGVQVPENFDGGVYDMFTILKLKKTRLSLFVAYLEDNDDLLGGDGRDIIEQIIVKANSVKDLRLEEEGRQHEQANAR